MAVLAWVDNFNVVLAPDLDDRFEVDHEPDVKDIFFLRGCREREDAVLGGSGDPEVNDSTSSNKVCFHFENGVVKSLHLSTVGLCKRLTSLVLHLEYSGVFRG